MNCSTPVALFSLGVCSAFVALPTPARADLMLTSAGVSQGFTLSTFATGFPTSTGGSSPTGITFPSSGGVLTAQPNSNTVGIAHFGTDVDGQTFSRASTVGGWFFANGLTTSGGKVYAAVTGGFLNGNVFLPAGVYQLTAGGTFVRLVTPLAGALGIATNPTNGDLWVTTQVASGHIFDVNPLTGTVFDWSAAHGDPNHNLGDGIAFSADGRTLYLAIGGVQGFDVATGALVFNSSPIPGFPDGIALGTGSLAGLAFVNTNAGTVWEVSLDNAASPILIANGGSRGDFLTPDPSNNSLLLSQSDRVVRLTAPPGGGFVGGQIPEPSSLVLLASGLAALAGYGTFRRRDSHAPS